MRQHRPTTLVLAVSLALFAQAALAQTSTRAGASPSRPTAVTPAETRAVPQYEPGVVIGVDPNDVAVTETDSTAAPSPARPSPELDRLTRKQQQKEKVAARTDRQLVQSIAPRTGKDRTDQMRDDPIGPRY